MGNDDSRAVSLGKDGVAFRFAKLSLDRVHAPSYFFLFFCYRFEHSRMPVKVVRCSSKSGDLNEVISFLQGL